MLRNIILMLACLQFLSANGQKKPSFISKTNKVDIEKDEKIIKKVAENIIKNTSFTIKSKKTGINYSSFDALPDTQLTINPYNEWKYWNGILGIGMKRMSSYFGDSTYSAYMQKNIRFSFDHAKIFRQLTIDGRLKGMEQFFKHELLDDCGAMAGCILEAYKMDARKDYRKYIDKTADYILHDEHRIKDGTLARTWPQNMTIWLDDLYMSVPFLGAYGRLTNKNIYFDFALKQVFQFNTYLFDKKMSIYHHCYYANSETNGPAFWGRANGWVAMAQVELLQDLPSNYTSRDSLLTLYKRQIEGISKYQSETGLWHQLLDKSDSYEETSASAMFTYAIAKGVNNGWLDTVYADLAINGWDGIKTMIMQDGNVKNICKGTGTNTSLKYYYDRPTPINDIHGLGPVLMAGIEILKLKNNMINSHFQ